MLFLSHLDRLGYVHFRRWKLYGEETLARSPAVVWVHGDALTVEYEEMPHAQYTVHYQPDKKHFKDVPVKLIKRQMFGRGTFDLLRKRVPHCA